MVHISTSPVPTSPSSTPSSSSSSTTSIDERFLFSENNQQFCIISCVQCREGHVKCSRAYPTCSTCRRRGLECSYQPRKKRTSLSNHNNNNHSSNSNNNNSRFQSLDNSSQFIINQTQIVLPPVLVTHCTTSDQFDKKVECVLVNAVKAVALIFAPSRDQSEMSVLLSDQSPTTVVSSSMIHKSNQQHTTMANHLMEAITNKGKTFYQRFGFMMHVQGSMNGKQQIFSEYDIYDLITKRSRSELRQGANMLFTSAKNLLLNPEIYPHLANNIQLGQACSSLAIYLMSSGREDFMREAKLFLRGLKVNLAMNGSIIHSDLSCFNGSQYSELEQRKMIVMHLTNTYYKMKLRLLLNQEHYQFNHKRQQQQQQHSYHSTTTTTTVTTNHIERLYHLLTSLKKYLGKRFIFLPQNGLRNQYPIRFPVEHFDTLIQLLDRESDDSLKRLYEFVKSCQFLTTQTQWIPEERPAVKFFWFMILNVLQFFATNIELQNHQSMVYNHPHHQQTIAVLKELRLGIANAMSNFAFEKSEIFVSGGVFQIDYSYFLNIFNCHIEHVYDFIQQQQQQYQQQQNSMGHLEEMLIYLRNDRALAEAVHSKFDNPDYAIITRELSDAIEKLLLHQEDVIHRSRQSCSPPSLDCPDPYFQQHQQQQHQQLNVKSQQQQQQQQYHQQQYHQQQQLQQYHPVNHSQDPQQQEQLQLDVLFFNVMNDEDQIHQNHHHHHQQHQMMSPVVFHMPQHHQPVIHFQQQHHFMDRQHQIQQRRHYQQENVNGFLDLLRRK